MSIGYWTGTNTKRLYARMKTRSWDRSELGYWEARSNIRVLLVLSPKGTNQRHIPVLLIPQQNHFVIVTLCRFRVLKPFIRRDYESSPLWLKLLTELQTKVNNKSEKWIPPPKAPVDFSYVRPQHIPAINSLAQQYFWPGINCKYSGIATLFDVLIETYTRKMVASVQVREPPMVPMGRIQPSRALGSHEAINVSTDEGLQGRLGFFLVLQRILAEQSEGDRCLHSAVSLRGRRLNAH